MAVAESLSTAGKWIEVRVDVDAESVDAVAELFSRYAYNQGVVIHEPYRQDTDGDNLEIDPTRPVAVSAYLPDSTEIDETIRRLEEGLWYLSQLGAVGQLERIARPEEDWANAWKEHFQVTRIGRRFVIRPTWRDYQPKPDDVVIDLDPGMAFGTGLHPTTEMSLRWLEELPVDGQRMLDAGAGSGILSIAAAKLGATSIDAVEVDPVAVSALRQNIVLNGCDEIVDVHCGDATSWLPSDQPYDLVVANIISRILIEAAANLSRACRPNATLVLSGVIEAHEASVVETYQRLGFEFLHRRTGGDWVSLVARKQQ